MKTNKKVTKLKTATKKKPTQKEPAKKKFKIEIEGQYSEIDGNLNIHDVKCEAGKINLVTMNNLMFHTIVQSILQVIETAPLSKRGVMLLNTRRTLPSHFDQHLQAIDAAIEKLL